MQPNPPNPNEEVPRQPAPITTKSTTWMGYAQDHPGMTIFLILIIIFLIWFFCFRKPEANGSSATTSGGQVQVTRMRGGGAY